MNYKSFKWCFLNSYVNKMHFVTDLACIMCKLPHLKEFFNVCDELWWWWIQWLPISSGYNVAIPFDSLPWCYCCGLIWDRLHLDTSPDFLSLALYSFLSLFNFQNGMHSLCPAVWSKHRRWLLMSMLCLNPLACVRY